jgi:hypothetical protein
VASRAGDLFGRAHFLATREYQWAVGAVALGAPDFVAHLCEHGAPPAAPVRWLAPPPRPFSFVTDPRCVTWRGEVWVFFEAFRPWAGRGVIGVARHDARLGFVDPRPLLDVPGLHLAYPTVLVEGDELVCLPDSSCPDGTLVFRGTEPGALRAAGMVPGVPPLRDPTVLEHEGGLVLVGLDIRPRSPILRAFRSETLAGPWTEAGDPIDAGDGTARPAGSFVRLPDGRLVRPAQDSRARYGGGIVLREVHLDGDYREEPLAEAGPDPSWAFPLAFHTISGTDEVTFFDGYRHHATLLAGPRRLSRHFVGVSTK